MKKSAWSIALALCCGIPAVNAGDYMLMPNIGKGQLKVDRRYLISDTYDNNISVYSLGLLFGYRFDSNVIIAGSTSVSSGEFFNFTDRYELKERGVLAGYAIDIGNKFRLIPMLGYSRWRFDTEEGIFLNPGPEAEARFHGSDMYGKLNLEWVISSVFQLNFAYQSGDYDIGHVDTSHIGFKFEF